METIDDWNQRGQTRPQNKNICQIFESQVEKKPENIAVRYENKKVSYKNLNREINQLARLLQKELSIRNNKIVTLYLNRSIEIIVAIFGVLKAGGAYLIIEVDTPKKRTDFILEDTDSKIIITSSDLERKISAENNQYVVLIDKKPHKHLNDSNLPITIDPESSANIIFTSGTTGKPKGVINSHLNIVEFIQNDFIRVIEDDSFAFFSSPAFDASIFEIFKSLGNGARLTIPSDFKSLITQPDRLCDFLYKEKITVLFLTKSLFDILFLRNNKLFRYLKYLMVGGEVLDVNIMNQLFLSKFGPKHLISCYGPTECTVFSSVYYIDKKIEGKRVPIGRPIENKNFHVLDDKNCPVPKGVAGNLYISGAGIAKGYLKRERLTQEKFFDSRIFNGNEKTNSNGRTYKTGDLVRQLPDGNIDFIGREDFQVKIRGYRVEIGEIEGALINIKNISQACVICDNKQGNKSLIGYYKLKEHVNLSSDEIKNKLRESLPDYIIPPILIQLDIFPLMANGKLDRKALPDPKSVLSTPTVNSQGDKLGVLDTCSRLLGLPIQKTNNSLISLGFNSLLIVQLENILSDKFNFNEGSLNLNESFTIDDLVKKIQKQKKDASENLPLIKLSKIESNKKLIPLSYQQLPIWFLTKSSKNNLAYNAQFTVHFCGELDVKALENALTEMIKRHEPWRTTYEETDDGSGLPVQKIHEPWQAIVNFRDLTEVDHEQQSDIFEEKFRKIVSKTFDISNLPLIKWDLFKLSKEEHILLQTEHHFLHDGWSVAVFSHELKFLYSKYTLGTECDLPPLLVQYKDFSLWQNNYISKCKIEEGVNNFIEKYPDVPHNLNLTTDFRRPAVNRFSGKRLDIELPKNTLLKIKKYASSQEVTTYTLMLATFGFLINIYSNQTNMFIGTTTANRLSKKLEGIMGMLVNTFPVNLNISWKESFDKLLQKTKKSLRDANSWKNIPLYELAKRACSTPSSNGNPIFQVMFGFHDSVLSELKWDGLEATINPRHNKSAKMDLNVICMPNYEELITSDNNITKRESKFLITWEFNTDLFRESTVRNMAENYIHLLDSCISDSKSTLVKINRKFSYRISDYHKTMEFGVKNNHQKYGDISLCELFEAQVRKTPDNIAIKFKSGNVTFEELNGLSNQLAKYLIHDIGIKPGDIVSLYFDRCIEVVIGMLGVLKAGGAYVPLAPEYPTNRIEYILNETKSQSILTSSILKGKLHKKFRDRSIALDDKPYRKFNTDNIPLTNKPSDLAYVIYTSGTSGPPKGVMNTHRNIVNFVSSNFIEVNSENSFSFLTSPVFDVSIFEIFTPLTHGAMLVIPDDFDLLISNISEFRRYICENRISVMWLTKTLFNTLYIFDQTVFGSVKYLLIGGEPLDLEVINKFYQNRSKPKHIINGYGPTEGTVFSSVFYVDHTLKGTVVPIGSPISGRKLYVLNEYMHPSPIGAVGELYIGGAGVSAGYLNRDKLTNEKFIEDPFATREDIEEGMNRLYKTGDFVRWLSNGTLEYIGREDFQVKIGGYRIELGEVENALLRVDGVNQACVVVNKNEKRKYLAAYYTSKNEINISDNEILSVISKDLPSYSLPSIFIRLKAFPKTVNGKLDREALPKPYFQNKKNKLIALTKTQKLLCKIWEDCLQIENIDIQDSFFQLGGGSLASIEILHRINREFCTGLSLVDFFNSPSIFQLSTLIDSNQNVSAKKTVSSEVLKVDSSLSTYDIRYNKPHLKVNKIENILLTGVTGFVGVHLLFSLLETTNANIYCVIRGSEDIEIRNRFNQKLHKYKLNAYVNERRIYLIKGDLSKPSLNLSSQRLDDLSKKIDIIYHCGAHVHHVFPYEALKPTNVLGTVEIIKLAITHKVKPIYFISTVGAAIRLDKEGDISEDFPGEDIIQKPIGYYQTKWVSEKLLTNLKQMGHPVSIFRLGRISGGSRNGICNFERDHFQLLIKSCIEMGYAPDLKKTLNFLPVDITAKLIVKLSLLSGQSSQVFNIVCGDKIKWEDYINLLKSKGYRIELQPLKDWLEGLEGVGSDNALYTLKSFYLNPSNIDIIEGKNTPAINIRKVKKFLSENAKEFEFPEFYPILFDKYLSCLQDYGFLPPPPNKIESSENFAVKEKKYDCNFNDKYNLTIIEGANSKVWDIIGNEYLDCISGMGVINVGHKNPKIIRAIKEQAETLSVCHHSYTNDKRALFLESLASILPAELSKIFLCNSGAEAVEAALKTSIAITKRRKIIACTGGYHGLTLGATGLASAAHLRAPYVDILNEASFVEFNNISQLESAIDNETAMVIFELVQGSGGGDMANSEFVNAARRLTSEVGAQLIFDEVLTGFCRTGMWFSTSYYGVIPDGILMAKAIGGGLPIGAFAMKENISLQFPKGIHSNTFGGNPMSMASGLAAIEFAKETNLSEQARDKGSLFRTQCEKLIGYKLLKVKGMGLLIGLELTENCLPYVSRLREEYGILAIPRNKTILFLPPLTMTNYEIKKIVNSIGKTLKH